VGGPADHRSIAIARRHGITIDHVARQYDPRRDPEVFQHLIAMDRSNARHVVATGAPSERVRLMRSFDPSLSGRPDHEIEVPDPYEWPGDGFEEVYQMLHRACEGLLDSVAKKA
jgi:protein-tyrosine phosphatase